MVNNPPWDVDGDHHYKILCDEDSWVDKQRDGRWWVMTTSSRLGLQGKCKVGSCQGSRICQNVDCPKLQSKGVCNINPKDFVSENGAFVCKSCGYYAVEIYCGCRKVTEYNKQTQELDVWYEGEHNCTQSRILLRSGTSSNCCLLSVIYDLLRQSSIMIVCASL